MPRYAEVARTDHEFVSYDGARVLARWYTPPGTGVGRPGPAAVYVDGGGMITGSVDLHDPAIAACAAYSGVPLPAVCYRLAPEHRPDPGAGHGRSPWTTPAAC
ncbi:alpha/beta hydrolase [Streptomyces sp. NPDC002514]|uniref:alpha/beta hydrolase n=1 Tax=Streptomyces sp. NPDC001270 TaxID=3364554 RepID=UPI0036CAD84F